MNIPLSVIHSLVFSLPARRKGFSLIELMVAMTIGLFLLAGLFSIYLTASQSSRFQSAMAQMQNNARYAFELMATDIRMLGFTGSQDTNPANVVNILLTSPICLLIDIFGNKNCTNGAGPMVGYENTNPPNVSVCTTASQQACYLADPDNDPSTDSPDSLTVVRVDTETKYALDPIVWPLVAGSFTLSTSTWPATWSTSSPAGEIFVAADYTHAAVFQVGSINTSTKTIFYSTGASPSPGNSSTTLGTFGGGVNAMGLYRLSGISYYIGRNPVGEPALYREKLGQGVVGGTLTMNSTAEELVQGVENMQITYGVDTSSDIATRNPLPGDGNVDGYWTAAEVNAGAKGGASIQSVICDPAGATTAFWKCVLSIRIQLTLVSGQNEKVGTTADRLLRKTFTNTIAIRNRL